jgi:transcriptional regulator GlxA family with amidase domain
MLSLGVASATFGARPGLTGFEFTVCSDRTGPLATDLGLLLTIENDLAVLTDADLILVLPGERFREPASDAVCQALRDAHARGATIAAHCVGTFLLAQAGLADDVAVTTHWQFADELAQRHPRLTVRPEELYIDTGRIVTGAGAAAGIDMCLHLLRREHGAAAANHVARSLVVPPHREGGQRQFVSTPVCAGTEDGALSGLIEWARTHLDHRLSIGELAALALMSRRTFVRRFIAATGSAPHQWVVAQRLNMAEELLETTDLSVTQIADRVGVGSAAVLREQFTRRRGVTPTNYRTSFRT